MSKYNKVIYWKEAFSKASFYVQENEKIGIIGIMVQESLHF